MCIESTVRQIGMISTVVLMGLLVGCGGGSGSDRAPANSGDQQPSTGDDGGSGGAGGDGGSGDSNDVIDGTPVSLYFSDAPVNDAAKVVISVDRITFESQDGRNIVVDTFTSPELGIEDAEIFQLDLLEVQGTAKRMVIDQVNLPPGSYTGMRILVRDGDVNESYVEQLSTGEMVWVEVTAHELVLPAFTIPDTDQHDLVVEFSLRQSLDFNSAGDHYILKSVGLRVVPDNAAATLRGQVDLNAIREFEACAEQTDPAASTAAYLYQGHGHDPADLGDVFIREGEPGAHSAYDPNVPERIIAPHAVAGVDEEGNYVLPYLRGGDYTLAIACQVNYDDPVIYEGFGVPLAASERVELSLSDAEEARCDFPLNDGACADSATE
ncbi:DUF4382 domain-containing protein [Gilvimarinus sp. F26214L]|uniref:DUF4382 domain-containing protein n=1 Tax=Gilvimarinus sp. DZF01 TaxID=3461371 RepID=UPI00404541AE